MPKWRWRIDGRHTCALFSVLLVGAGGGFAGLVMAEGVTRPLTPSSGGRNTGPSFEEALLEVHLNGLNLRQTALVLVRPDGRVLARGQDLARWRLRVPDTPVQTYQDEPYILLDAIGAVTYRVDAATQSLQIDAPADHFLPSTLDARPATRATPHMPSVGGFLNYDLSAQRSQGMGTVGAQLELGVFAGGGVGTTQMLDRDLSAGGSFIRLESTLTMDSPEQRASLRLGDAISRGGAWGRPVRFGGIQWGSNFATQPDFITFPLPSIFGSAALPSTAEVFVNNVRTYQHDIPAGPFSVRELPVVTGQGEVRMVVRDLLGREQVIVQPFYAARSLLKPGLDDFSYEFGAVRKNFGLASNDYGPWMLAGTRRHGFTDHVTGEVHGEFAPGRQTLGFAATTLFPGAGVVDAAIAGSHGDWGGGGLLALGFDRQTPRWSFGLRTQIASRHFNQLGLAPGTLAPVRQTNAHMGWNDARIGSFGLGYIRLDNRGPPGNEVLSASYSRHLGWDWFLGLSAFKSLKGSQDAAVGLVLTHALGKRTTASLSASRRNGPDAALLQVQKNLSAGTGVGYRVLAGTEGRRLEGALNLKNDYGTYALEAARFRAVGAWRASASGGLAVLGGRVFLTCHLGDSFAVVRVPGYPGVQVYAENQPIARTNASGTALVPRLRPYQKNRIGIEQGDLPLDARIGALELNAVPYYRSGYDLEFPVGKANGALLRLVTADGRPVPAGALVRIAGREETFPVAGGGQVYLSGLTRNNRVEVTFGDTRYEFQLSYPETDAPLPDLGDFPCIEIKP